MAGLTLGLMSVSKVELEVLTRSGTAKEKKQAACVLGVRPSVPRPRLDKPPSCTTLTLSDVLLTGSEEAALHAGDTGARERRRRGESCGSLCLRLSLRRGTGVAA